KTMCRLVREAMEQGAVGLSTGMDYIPSRYAEVDELVALCREMAPFGGIYVTHMWRYDAEGVAESMDKVFRIGREADVGVHISHFNSRAELVLPRLDDAAHHGIDATFDLYCYLAGSSILGMVALPPWVQEGGIEPTLARLRDPDVRVKLHSWFKAPRVPLENVRISFVSSPSFRHLEGKTLEQTAASMNKDLGEAVCDLLVACDMAAGCVAPHLNRTGEDIRQLMRHPAMMAGSDGIYTGSHPHPRGCGCFARYLGHYVREAKVWTLEEAVQHLSAHAARRFGLKDRGLIRQGLVADLVVFDPDAITDRSTFDDGRRLAVGVDTVLVNGTPVLWQGQRTPARPGRGLKRQ